LTEISHPWTNCQVERMNRTIKEVTARRYQYGEDTQRPQAKRLVYAAWQNEPERASSQTRSTKCWTKHLGLGLECLIGALRGRSAPAGAPKPASSRGLDIMIADCGEQDNDKHEHGKPEQRERPLYAPSGL
jgi:hypothetical protein